MSDTKRMTLYEMALERLRKKEEVSPELKIFNPLKAKIGDFVSIDAADLSGTNFLVTELDVYKQLIGSETFEFTDYPLRDGDKWVTVRVNPVANPDPYSHKHYNVLVLYPDFEMQYDEEFCKNILNSGGPLEVKDGEGRVLATYNRLFDGATEPVVCEVMVLKDLSKPLERETVSCWDFGRNLEDKSCEFYFVEMNNNDHMFQMFRGIEVSEKDITLLPISK